MAPSSAGFEDDPRLQRTKELIAELCHKRDTYFPPDAKQKQESLQSGIEKALAALEEAIAVAGEKPMKRAVIAYLRGKALDVVPDYSKEAEEQLSKAVKLDPSLADAWACLGNSYWKKDDLVQAKNCFTMALTKGPHKAALQALSMLERRVARLSTGTEEASLVEDSVRHAKEAVALDVADGHSWYTLGNAYLTQYFTTGAWDIKKLHQSLKSYQNAERDEAAQANPDLHFNSAVCHRYLENYGRALAGFSAAAARDPGLHAEEEIQRTIRMLSRLEDLTRNKGRLKAKKLTAMLSALANEKGPSSHRGVGLGELKDGLGKGVVLIAKVLLTVPSDNSVPLSYIMLDKEGACFVLLAYAVRDGVIKEDSTVMLLDPWLNNHSIEWEGKTYAYPSIRVDHPQQLLVAGKPLRPADAARSKLLTDNKPT